MARTRGIVGNKPALDSSPFSDVLGLDSTYVATTANVVYPSVDSGSFPVAGLAIAQSGGMTRPINNQYIYFKKSNTWDFFKYPATQTASSLSGNFYGVTATPGGTCVSFLRSPPSGTLDVRIHTYLKDSNGGYSSESNVLATGASINSYCGEYNPAGTILALAASSSPYIYLYSRNGATLTRLSDPASLPPDCSGSSGDILNWSPDGQYLAMCTASSPYFIVWKVSGTTFTKINNPATLPAGGTSALAWNHNGNSLAVSYNTVVYLYNKSGDTLTYANSFTTSRGAITSMDWNHNGTLLAVNGANAPYYTILQRSGDTLSSSGITLKTMSGGTYGVPMFKFSKQAYDNNNTSLLGYTNGSMWFNTITTGGVTTKANILGTTTGFANNDGSDNNDVTVQNFCFIYN